MTGSGKWWSPADGYSAGWRGPAATPNRAHPPSGNTPTPLSRQRPPSRLPPWVAPAPAGPGTARAQGRATAAPHISPPSVTSSPNLLTRRRDHGLGAVAGRGVRECLADPREREARRDQSLDAELRHERQGPSKSGAPTESATDSNLTKVDIPQVQRQPASLRVHADELEDSRRPGEPDRFRDQLRLAHGFADDVRAAVPRERHHAIVQALPRRVDDDVGAQAARDPAALLDQIGEDQAPGAPAASDRHREEPHDAAADDEHRRPARHGKGLEPRQAAGGGLGPRRRLGIEAARQRMHAAGGQRDALGKAADADRARALRDAPRLARGALPAAVRRLARNCAPEQAPAHAAAHLTHDARVLVAHHQ